MSLFSFTRKFSIRKPCGLLSERTEFLQRAGRNKTALCNVALTDDKLPCIGRYRIRVSIKVAVDRVHLYALIDIARYGTVIIALLCQVFVIVEGRLVTQHEARSIFFSMASLSGAMVKNSS